MKILEHSRYDETSIALNLGEAEYSYWFVRKAFRPILAQLGELVSVAEPEQADAIYRAARNAGEDCLLLSYNPPHYLPANLECPTIPVFAWEFAGIPDESFEGNSFHDWRAALRHAGRAVTHASAVADAVRDRLGEDYPIWSIPAPIYDRVTAHRGTARGRIRASIPLENAFAIDVGRIDIGLFHAARMADGARALRVLAYTVRQETAIRRHLDLDGVVYTAIFNPLDGRKNWNDMIAAFVAAFANASDVTLMLKLNHADMLSAIQPVLTHIANLGRFSCRIVLIHGLLSDEGYAGLIAASSYAVNVSWGEGQCLPLMEFMSAGRPAVAPAHSAMRDYVTPSNAFVVPSDIRPTWWPHDDRMMTRCYKHVVRFEALVAQFRVSYRVACEDPDTYARMSAAAIAAQEAYCSDRVVLERLRGLFAGELPPRIADPVEISGETAQELPMRGKRGFLSRLFDREAPVADVPDEPARAQPAPAMVLPAIPVGVARHAPEAQRAVIAAARDLPDGAIARPDLIEAVAAEIYARQAACGILDGPLPPVTSGLRVRHEGLPEWWASGRNLLLAAPETTTLRFGLGLMGTLPEDMIVVIGRHVAMPTLHLAGTHGLVAIGDRTVMRQSAVTVGSDTLVLIGEGSTATSDCTMEVRNGGCIVLGDDAMLASGVDFMTDDMHAIRDAETKRRINARGGRIVIERHVWLGNRCQLMGDCYVEHDAIVGQQSFLKNQRIPASAIAVGRPARVVKTGITWTRDDDPD